MRGSLIERSPGHWAIIIPITDPATGRKKQKWHSFRGGRRQAERERARLIAEIDSGVYVAPAKMTTIAYFADWLHDYAPMKAGPKTLERYAELVRHITSAIGGKPIQQVRGGDLNRLYRNLADKGLAPLTVRHVHAVARQVFRHAIKLGDLKRNPCSEIDAPTVPGKEASVLRPEEIPVMLAAVRGTMLEPIVVLALGTGMRRGEILALRFSDIDLDAGVLRVERSLEQTKAGLRFKPPKSARGRRTISLSPSLVVALREHRKQQLELRMKLGSGKLPIDALVFATIDGKPHVPDVLTHRFAYVMTKAGLPHVGLHALRHTHASLLIHAAVDILTVSRRLGHSSAAITLNVYGHIIGSQDRAADVMEDILQAP
jgi:integrase